MNRSMEMLKKREFIYKKLLLFFLFHSVIFSILSFFYVNLAVFVILCLLLISTFISYELFQEYTKVKKV